MIIYQITNVVNGKRYIGKTTKSAEDRLKKHFYNAKSGQNTHLYKAIRKYGEASFTIEVVENTDEQQLNEREIFWISKLSPEYNMTIGGDGGDTSNSENFINSMNAYHSRLSPEDYATYGMLGKNHSLDSKRKISKSNSCPVMCEGKRYDSVGDAERAYPGIKLRNRLDSSRYPDFFRLKPKASR